jgi:predicted exporter
MLMAIYRSPLPLVLVITPVAFGLLLGVLVVQALFGTVHGITLGFAATLIGEAVDYPNYLLLNTAPGESAASAARRIRPTLTLAVLTTIASALALTLSSFTGLAQLGVLTMVGVAVAGLMTHRVIPWLMGAEPLLVKPLRLSFFSGMANTRAASVLAVVATAIAALWLAYTYPAWWEQDLANISPIPSEMRALDAELRRDMGAPEVGSLLASSGGSEQAALQAAENMLPLLQQWQAKGLIHSFDSPAFYLPSPQVQAARLKALPDTEILRAALQQALRGLPFRADAFTPFVEDMAKARAAPPLVRASYAGTPLGAKLNALIVNQDGQWLALTTLGGVTDRARLNAAVAALPADQQQSSQLVDLKQVSTRMVNGYRQQALQQAALGAALIVLLLVIGLRSLRRSLRVLAPNAAALILTTAILIAMGQLLSVFHLVALLLVVGIGLNYALFFERTPADAAERTRTRMSLAVCSLSTIVTFSFLGSSATPVLRAIGSTVALGAVLSLLLSAFWTQRREG